MYGNYKYCKAIQSDHSEFDGCDIYWDDYRLGKVCYTYDKKNGTGEVVYRSEELSHISEVIVRKFFNIPSMEDLKKRYSDRQIHDSHDVLKKSNS